MFYPYHLSIINHRDQSLGYNEWIDLLDTMNIIYLGLVFLYIVLFFSHTFKIHRLRRRLQRRGPARQRTNHPPAVRHSFRVWSWFTSERDTTPISLTFS